MKALIIGCSEHVWKEVEQAQAMCQFDKIYCVKLAGVDWPHHFDVWVTLHPEFMDDYEAQRKAKGYPGGYEIVAPLEGETRHGKKGNISRRITYRWKGMTSSASSGIFAAKIALDDGHSRVVLAGIPMDTSKHFKRHNVWTERDCFLPGFMSIKHLLVGKVRSMSGLTKQYLGEPTPEWLQGDPVAVNSVQDQAGCLARRDA